MITASMPAPTLDTFFQRLRTSNPFLANRVDRMLATDLVDVPDIHQAEFQRILDLAGQAHDDNRGIGVVVWGEAGIGKSHLLARLSRWAQGRACFVYLHNLQANPERLPRYIVMCVLNVLTQGQASPLWRTPLFDLINVGVKEALGGPHIKRAKWSEIEPAYHAWIARLAAHDAAPGVLLDRTVQEVLLRFFRAANPFALDNDERIARLAVRWLAGDYLDAAEARQIGVRPADGAGSGVALLDNQHIKQVLVGLTRIARSGKRLFLLCFDQADNLDEEQVRSLSRFLHDLLDSAGNLLVVTTGVRQTLLSYQQQGVITETSWDRIGQFTVLLGRIGNAEGRALLAARLQRFLEPVNGLSEIVARRTEDSLFPLGSAWYEQRVEHLPDFRPRDLLTWAGERWQGLQEGLTSIPESAWLDQWPNVPEGRGAKPGGSLAATIDHKVEQKLAEQTAFRRREPNTLPPSEDNLLGLVYELLRQCLGHEDQYRLLQVRTVAPLKSGARPPYDLLVGQHRGDEGPAQVGVRFLTATNANSATTSLRRLVEDPDRPDHVLLVTDERQPLPLGPRGQEYHDELKQRGPERFREVALSFADYVALDGLQAVIGLARGGDLEVEFPTGKRRPLREADVIASHHRRQRYLAHPLLRELLGDKDRLITTDIAKHHVSV
jgi:hypothetical protein